MSKTRISGLLGRIAVVVIVGYSLFAEGKCGGGSGTPEGPYQIWDAGPAGKLLTIEMKS